MYRRHDVHGLLRDRSARLAGGTGSALGFASAVVAALLGGLGGGLFGWSAREPITLGLLVVSVVCVSAVTTFTGALGTAVQSWAVYSGFVVHRLGELRLAPTDRATLVCLVASALLAHGLSRVYLGVLGHPRRGAARLPDGRYRPRLAGQQPLVSTVTEVSIPRQERSPGR